jgi:hypothetical protein
VLRVVDHQEQGAVRRQLHYHRVQVLFCGTVDSEDYGSDLLAAREHQPFSTVPRGHRAVAMMRQLCANASGSSWVVIYDND